MSFRSRRTAVVLVVTSNIPGRRAYVHMEKRSAGSRGKIKRRCMTKKGCVAADKEQYRWDRRERRWREFRKRSCGGVAESWRMKKRL